VADAPTLAQSLAEFAADVRRDGAPAEVSRSVAQRVLDVLGLCVAAQDLDTSRAVTGLVEAQGGTPEAHIVGLAVALPAAQAALANGVLAHSLDFDDTHLPSVLHPSAVVVPAALAVAESVGANGRALVDAVAVGLEVTVRLGMAGYDEELGNSVFFEHGQHATSICGAMGAAVSAGMLLGLSRAQLVDVLGVTASMSSGIIEGNRTGGTVKRMHCGWAAHAAVMAAQLVQRGYTGPPTVLEGRFGFFEAFLRGEANPAAVSTGLGTTWAVPDIFFKPYPANHFTHTAIDAGLALRARGVRVEDIVAIRLGVPSAVVRTIGEPLATKQAPETGYQAQFSGPYAVVAGLLGGGGGLAMGLDDYRDDLARDPVRRSLMALVTVEGDEVCDGIFPHEFPAVVTVTLRNGSAETESVLTNRGGPRRPLSDEELGVKFSMNCAGHLPDHRIAEVRDLVLGLDGPLPADVRNLMPLLADPTPPAPRRLATSTTR
jgi:2-methylcitrate dehydratase PrpD